MIKRIINSKDRKVLIENFLSLSIIQVVSLIISLITLPYIIRTIGFEKYGITVIAWSLINYFTSITDFSFKFTATREVAVCKNNIKKLSIIYSKVLTVQALLILLSCLLIIIVVYSYEPFYKERLIFWVTMPYLFGNTIFPDWFFQGMERMKYMTYINVSIKLIFMIFIFIFINEASDYWLYPLFQTLGYIISGLIGQWIMVRQYKVRFYWLKSKTIVHTFKDNMPVFINQFLPNLYNNTSTFLLGIMTNNTLVGIYDAVRKIINLGSTLMDIVSRVFFPFISRRKDAFDKYKTLMTYVGVLLTILPIVFYKVILWYLNIQYENIFAVLTILSIGLFFLSLYDIYGINYFIARRKDKIVMRNTIFSSIVGLILSYLLIYYFDILGAALTITLVRMFMGGGLYLKYLQVKKVAI